jgi:thiamine biosynthesis protein ThiS
VNKGLVPKREHDGRRLEDGDRVELVTLVGGG